MLVSALPRPGRPRRRERPRRRSPGPVLVQVWRPLGSARLALGQLLHPPGLPACRMAVTAAVPSCSEDRGKAQVKRHRAQRSTPPHCPVCPSVSSFDKLWIQCVLSLDRIPRDVVSGSPGICVSLTLTFPKEESRIQSVPAPAGSGCSSLHVSDAPVSFQPLPVPGSQAFLCHRAGRLRGGPHPLRPLPWVHGSVSASFSVPASHSAPGLNVGIQSTFHTGEGHGEDVRVG